jgi:hypothetical protein
MAAVARARMHPSIGSRQAALDESAHKAVLQKVYPLPALTQGQGRYSRTVWPPCLALSEYITLVRAHYTVIYRGDGTHTHVFALISNITVL